MSFRLTLAKEDFKFSAAHFTLFDGQEAEPLHGHNYRVTVELEGEDLDAEGLLVSIGPAKEAIRDACARLDDRVLIPARSPHLRIEEIPGTCRVRYAGRHYEFPSDEVLRLPLINTTIELLARHLWSELVPVFRSTPVRTIAVAVEESDGQSGRYAAALGS